MSDRIYKPLEEITYEEALEILEKDKKDELLLLPLRVGEGLTSWKHAQDICLKLMDNEDSAVRANAALGLAYIARTKGMLDKRVVKPYLLRELKENTEYNWRIKDAIQDINLFLKWNIAMKHDI